MVTTIDTTSYSDQFTPSVITVVDLFTTHCIGGAFQKEKGCQIPCKLVQCSHDTIGLEIKLELIEKSGVSWVM